MAKKSTKIEISYADAIKELEQILEKMKQQAEAGLYVVPQSVNLSRMDFESCDVVEEIRRRVDDSGIKRSMITIEITESVIGGDFDFMK